LGPVSKRVESGKRAESAALRHAQETVVTSAPFIELVEMRPFDKLRERVVASIPVIELVGMRPCDRLRERGRAGVSVWN